MLWPLEQFAPAGDDVNDCLGVVVFFVVVWFGQTTKIVKRLEKLILKKIRLHAVLHNVLFSVQIYNHFGPQLFG